jgi:ATP phosphoribosyltransferase
MSTLIDINVASAERIIIPSGDDNEPCIVAFQQAFDIEIPDFAGKCREARSMGRTFYKQKGIDVPWMIGDGLADIGLTGSDSAMEDEGYLNRYRCRVIGEPMCRFVLLQTNETADRSNIRDRTRIDGNLDIEQVATSFPRYFGRLAANMALSLVPYPRQIRGGVEGAVRLLGLRLAADLVVEGNSARDNDLVEVETLDIVYPAVLVRRNSLEKAGKHYGN